MVDLLLGKVSIAIHRFLFAQKSWSAEMSKFGAVVWITGLPGSGKTTFMESLKVELLSNSIQNICLDGDKIRDILGLTNSFYSKQERMELGFRYSKLCKYLSDQNHVILIATVALFHEIQNWNRKNLVNYHEVYIDVTLSEIIERDQKELYSKFESKQIRNVVGLDIEFEAPVNPDYVVSSDYSSTNRIIHLIVNSLRGKINV
jgi:adenylylsulfate kinase-like enzyme